jgi:hypothetical protein
MFKLLHAQSPDDIPVKPDEQDEAEGTDNAQNDKRQQHLWMTEKRFNVF